MPSDPGVYLFLNERNVVLYVGKAKDLKKRVSSYFVRKRLLGEKTRLLVSQIRKIKVVIVRSEVESLLLEAACIKKYVPKFNARFTDGKSYPYIRISVENTYPSVQLVRNNKDQKSLYFGPFPNSGAVRFVLLMLRRIFPFQTVNSHVKRICLYYHLGQCVCPPVFDSPALRRDYKRMIRYLIRFLEGKKELLLKELIKKRDRMTLSERFEEAHILQKQIDAIQYVTSSSRQPVEYETNPNLAFDLRSQEIRELQEVLRNAGLGVSSLNRIECYDISNTTGTNAVGSMIVFVQGERNTSAYRRFKISSDIVGPNDVAMIKEVLRRRLTHKEWNSPDLIIVDGGKAQVSAAGSVVNLAHPHIPVIGLAKKEEVIVTQDFQLLRLPKSSPALQLVMRIRDEAHRFAVSYHRKLRSKFIFS